MRRPTRLLVLAATITAGAVLAGCADDTPHAELTTPAEPVSAVSSLATDASPTNGRPAVGSPHLVATFTGPMPTGVAVSRTGRIFVNFPRWGDSVEFAVGEVTPDGVVPFPDLETGKLHKDRPADTFVGVQSVVIDGNDHLWVVDSGSINFQPPVPGAPKLVCYDIGTRQVLQKITFSSDVILHNTYLNDVRFDPTRHFAYVSDSGADNPGIIVVDLSTGQSWRKLTSSPLTKADKDFTPTVEGQPLMNRPPNGPDGYMRIGCDGIEVSPDGDTLYFCPLAAHRLMAVPTQLLRDRHATDAQIAAATKTYPKPFASDGLLMAPDGALYLTDYEHDAIRRMTTPGQYTVVARSPHMLWPDSMSLGPSGDLYVTCNQLERQPQFHRDKDLRTPPFALFRIPLNHPVALR